MGIIINGTKRQERIAHAYEAFAEHEAKLYSGRGNIEILRWNKPGTVHYEVRYVFDLAGNRIYISGDLGAAVVHPTWVARFENTYNNVCCPNDDRNVNEGYFLEKLEATSDRYVYDEDEARAAVKENCAIIDEDDLEIVMADFHDEWGLLHIGDCAHRVLDDYDPDYWEWLPKAGQSIDGRIYLWLVGLKMAWQQIHEDGK